MLRRHLEEILDFAELDVQEDAIFGYLPWLASSDSQSCFAIRINKPFEEAAPKLAEFYVALGSVATGYASQNLYDGGNVDEVDSEGWSSWKVDIFPKYDRGEEPYTVFYFPDGKVED